MSFTAGASGERTFTLNWSGSADYDLYLADEDGYIQAWAHGSSTSAPEIFVASLTRDATYILWVAAWSGVAADYQIEIE